MSAIELPFRIGDSHWLPVTHARQVEIKCPVCAGNRHIVVVLGDGEHVRIPCEGCGIGFEGPRGYVSEWSYEPAASSVKITAIDSMRDGKWRVSTDDGLSHDFEEMRATEAEALEVSKERSSEAWERVMESHCRKRSVGHTGWTVRYHRMQIAELKKKLAWHESKVQAGK